MNIGKAIIDQFRMDCPMVHKLYGKSDNASCYHGNFIAVALYKMCKKADLCLLRYDFNEPCKGKDQCDRESAGAKAVINSFVSNGSKVECADDICKALHYGNGIKNAAAGVLEVDVSKSALSGTAMKNISAYHSIQFFNTYMKMYRYYNVGPGVTVNYTDESKFVPCFSVKSPYSQTQSSGSSRVMSESKKKKGKTHLIFCSNVLCTDTFESQVDLDNHLLSEKHTISLHKGSWDYVRSSYIEKIKVSSQFHTTCSSSEATLATVDITDATSQVALMENFTIQGWALPQRSNFKYSYLQKKLLYDMFMDGENNGKKRTPEQAALEIRRHVDSVEMYVKPNQIRALFSRWSKQYRDGTLKPPADVDTVTINTPEEIQDNDDTEQLVEADEDIQEEEMFHDLGHEVMGVMGVISDWCIEDYVAVIYLKQWYPGKVTKVNEDGTIEVSCLEYIDKIEFSNKFRKPRHPDIKDYNRDELLLKLNGPIEVAGKRSQYFKVNDDDFDYASDILRMVIR